MGYTLPTPPTTEEEKPTPPNTASSEASLDEGFVVEEQFTPPPTTTVKEEEEEEESISEGESRVRSRTSKMNINAMIDGITRPMVDVNKEAMVGAFWTALSIEAIELEEYEFMVGVLANGKQ